MECKTVDYIASIIDNHQISLSAANLPAMPWKAMIGFGALIATIYMLKFVGIIR